MAQITVESPTGPIRITEREDALVGITWIDDGVDYDPGGASSPLLAAAAQQLADYFARRRTDFSLPLAPAGTPFQRAVWQCMRDIPYGQTVRYGDIARTLGSGARAVGVACGRNPLPIVIPCHRVVGAGGALTGFSGGRGIATKQALLALEFTLSA
jgi:methylated-DNA-[protein]-cysteine S-methyltransferase